MKSKTTFKEEFDFLANHVPGALEFQQDFSLPEVLGNHFDSDSIFSDLNYESLEIKQLPYNFYESFFKEESKTKHYDNLSIFPEKEDLLDIATNSSLTNILVQNLFVNMGSEAFGKYLPMHRFFKNKHNGWGIYLFPEIIGPHVRQLFIHFKDLISFQHLLEYYIWCIYRHELFHFHTEHFATGMEVLMRKPYYLNYQNQIYRKLAKTEHWLEESLAEASVLESRLVANRIGLNARLRKKIYKYDLDQMPPGYRDYHCKKYGGPKEAHKYLAAQIIHLTETSPKPTLINTIKRDFGQDDKKVPVYMVTGFRSIKRLQ
jgi:hypothetical protein